jgi:hypothetical protein
MLVVVQPELGLGDMGLQSIECVRQILQHIKFFADHLDITSLDERVLVAPNCLSIFAIPSRFEGASS